MERSKLIENSFPTCSLVSFSLSPLVQRSLLPYVRIITHRCQYNLIIRAPMIGRGFYSLRMRGPRSSGFRSTRFRCISHSGGTRALHISVEISMANTKPIILFVQRKHVGMNMCCPSIFRIRRILLQRRFANSLALSSPGDYQIGLYEIRSKDRIFISRTFFRVSYISSI